VTPADTSSASTVTCGMTPREFGRLYRLSPDRVRAMILRGELQALNTAPSRCGRPRFIIMPAHALAWEQSRAAAVPPKPQRLRRKDPEGWIDFFPGD
jgi:hypothetical protein